MIVDHHDFISRADGFFGSVLAVEGITDACTILNGPTGCKLPLGEWSKDQYRRELGQSDMRYAEEFYFNQERVPCTYTDDYDYVFGSSEKLDYVFGRVADKGYAYIAVLNSPGASLIGDDLQRYIDWAQLNVPTALLDKPHFTESFDAGWTEAACTTIDAIAPVAVEPEPRTVNLVGLSIWQKHWQGSLAELERLLALCGIEVHSTLLADCTVGQIRQLRCAACNVVIHEELGLPVARHLADRYGMPFAHSAAGAPIGFDATEAWVRTACQAVGVDPWPALEEITVHRRRAARLLYRYTQKTGLPRGAGFGVVLEASLAWPLVRWLSEYLAMVPMAVQVPDENHPLAARLREYLASIGAADAWNAELSAERLPEAVFANDAVILRLTSQSANFVGIDLALPAKDVMHFVRRSILGPAGSMWLLESLCGGLWKRKEGDR